MDIKLYYTSYLSELSICDKDMDLERALNLAQNTHMRNKSVDFYHERSFLACVQICLSPYIYVK